MTTGLVMMDPALLAAFTTAARQAGAIGEATAARVAAIAHAAVLSPSAAVMFRDVAALAHDAAQQTQGILDRHAQAGEVGEWPMAGWAVGGAIGWRVGKPDAGQVADALATLRAHRGELDVDGDGTIDEAELRAATTAADPVLAASATFVLDGAPSYPSPTSADAPRPTVPELLAVVNSTAPGEQARVLADVASDVAGSGAARSLRFAVVAAGVPMDTSEREVGRVLSVEDVTVPTLDRLRVWDVPTPGIDTAFLEGLAPAGTAAVALTYRREQALHEYTIDPLRDVPSSVDQAIDHLGYLDTAYDAVNDAPFLGHTIGLAVDGIDWGLAVWNAVDDIVGDAHPRMDTAVEFDLEYFDADGASLGITPSVEIQRIEVTGPLFVDLGAVVVVPHVGVARATSASGAGDD